MMRKGKGYGPKRFTTLSGAANAYVASLTPTQKEAALKASQELQEETSKPFPCPNCGVMCDTAFDECDCTSSAK
jgi:predicted RNA-binding Zn-ribbon protein involved in translation (DUF1610 family)